jgi:hypothetical protein
MGIDTTFYLSLPLCFDEIEDEDFDVDEAWKAFCTQKLNIDGEEVDICWDLEGEELVASDQFRTVPDFWAQQLVYICEHFLQPHKIIWFTTCIPWTCSWGDHESGVLRVGDDLIKLVTVNMDGDVKTRNYPLAISNEDGEEDEDEDEDYTDGERK